MIESWSEWAVHGAADGVNQTFTVSGEYALPRGVEVNKLGESFQKTEQGQHTLSFRPV